MRSPQKKIGSSLRALLKANGYRTLELFAHENGFEKSYIAKLARGEVDPRLSTMIKLARSLDVTLDDLYPMRRKIK